MNSVLKQELEEFRAAAIVQGRVISALVLRETQVRFGKSQFGYLWAIVEPAAYVIVLSTIFQATGRAPALGSSMHQFFASGILPFFMYRNISSLLGQAFKSNKALLNFPIVKEFDTLVARLLLEVATSLMVMTFVFAFIHWVLGASAPNNFTVMATALFALTLFGFGVGTINAVLTSIFDTWGNIYKLFTMPLFILSGIFYTLESLPVAVKTALAWNPIIHGVEMFRTGIYVGFRSSALDINYLLWCGLFTTIIGLLAERGLRRWRI